MKKIKAVRQKFGFNEYGLIDFPKKISGVQITRIMYGDEIGVHTASRMALKWLMLSIQSFSGTGKNTGKPNGKIKSGVVLESYFDISLQM